MNTNQITSGEDDIPSIHLLTLVDSQEKTIETAVVWQNLRKTYRDVGPSNYVLDSRQLLRTPWMLIKKLHQGFVKARLVQTARLHVFRISFKQPRHVYTMLADMC